MRRLFHLDALAAELLVVEEALVDLVLQHRRVLLAKRLRGRKEKPSLSRLLCISDLLSIHRLFGKPAMRAADI